MRKAWRQFYRVWCQARLLNGEREWGAECLTCDGGGRMLTKFAMTEADAWKLVREHEKKAHANPTT